jgi:tetratricopeptide (TPR) repeat protein
MAFTLNDLVGVYWMSREPEKARSAQIEARDLWRELGNLPMLADNLARSTQFHLAAGDYAAVIAASDEAYAISRSIGNVWGQSNSRIGVGVAHWDQGEYGTAIAIQEEAIQLGVRVGHTIALTFVPTILALVYGAVGAITRGLEVANAALAHTRAKAPDWSSLPLITLARLHLLNRDLPATEAAYREAVQNLVEDNLRQVNYVSLLWLSLTEAELALARSKHAHALTLADQLISDTHLANYRPFIPDALYFKSRVLIAQGQLDLAHQSLEEARAEAEAIGSRRILWPILTALGEMEARQGNSTHANGLLDQARQIVGYIADHITDPEHGSSGPGTPDFYSNLRDSFLNLPDVRALRG